MELTKLPMGNKAFHNKWVYQVKGNHDGFKCYKSRLVVKVFQQKEWVDNTKCLAPDVNLNTFWYVSIVANEECYFEQLDVKTAFLTET
jgi:hypothetical protein